MASNGIYFGAEMTSDAPTNAEKHRTPNIACAHSQGAIHEILKTVATVS